MAKLYLKNKLIPATNIDAYQYSSDIITEFNIMINTVATFRSFYYSTNNFVLSLVSDAEDGSEPDISFSSIDAGIAWWKKSNDDLPLTFLSDNFIRQEISLEIISQTPYSIEFKISDASLNQIMSDFASLGITPPEHGALQFQLRFSDGFQTSYGVKYTNSPIFSAVIPPTEPAPIENTYTSPGVTFESLFIPNLTGSFIYNFYELNETNESITNKRDFKNFFLNDIPRYVRLSWDKAPITVAPPPTSLAPPVDVGSPVVGGRVISTEPPHPGIVGSAGLGGIFGREITTISSGSSWGSATDTTITYVGSGIPTSIPSDIVLGVYNSDYVGYIVQKEKMDQETGDFIPLEFFIIDDPNVTEFIDWKIVYGEVYRYKIKSLYRLVNKTGLSIYEDTSSSLTRQQELNVFGNSTINSHLYFFDSNLSNPISVECVDLVRPEIPYKFMLFPNSEKKNIVLTWNQKNPNLDVLGFNIYKKLLNSKNIFQKCNQNILDIRNNFYIDYNVEIDEEYIYAIETVDVHGNFSPLSTQMIAKITNFDIDLGRNEEKPRFYDYAGRELNKPITEELKKYTYFKNKLKIKINPFFGPEQAGAKFILRILSLDTLITKEVKMQFNITTVLTRSSTRQITGPVDPRVVPVPVAPGIASDLAGTSGTPDFSGFIVGSR